MSYDPIVGFSCAAAPAPRRPRKSGDSLCTQEPLRRQPDLEIRRPASKGRMQSPVSDSNDGSSVCDDRQVAPIAYSRTLRDAPQHWLRPKLVFRINAEASRPRRMRLETSKKHRCMLVIGSCVVDRTRVAAPGTIWLTGPALCSLVEHRLRGSKRDPKKQSFSVGPSWFPGTSHPRSTCRAQRASSAKKSKDYR